MVFGMKGCCCFRSLKTATVGAGMFTLVTSLIQILIVIAVFSMAAEWYQVPNLLQTFSDLAAVDPKQYYVVVLYIVLAVANAIVVLNSLLLLFGVDAKKPRPCYFWPWILFFPIYIIYESAINIYYFYWAFQTRGSTSSQQSIFNVLSNSRGFTVVPLIYWIVKDLIILYFWFLVIGYTRDVKKEAKAVKAVETTQVVGVPGDPYRGQTPGPVINRAQPVGLYQAFQPATYERPYYAMRASGYSPSGPYRIY